MKYLNTLIQNLRYMAANTTSANAVTLVWGSLRLAPIKKDQKIFVCKSSFKLRISASTHPICTGQKTVLVLVVVAIVDSSRSEP